MLEILRRDGVATAAQLRHHRHQLPALVADGSLRRPYPGVYVDAARAGEPLVRVRAAAAWLPRGVVVGDAARVVLGQPVRLDGVDMALRTGVAARGEVRLHRMTVPEPVEVRGVRIPDPAWNAAWLAAWDEGAAIDDLLRTGGMLSDIVAASESMVAMKGQQRRAEVVRASRDEPWSQAERRLHALLRQAGLHHWRTNVRLRAGELLPVVDVVMPGARLVIEVDGYEFHAGREVFEWDREKQAELVAAGWRVLRLTWRMIDERPAWVIDCLRRAIACAGQW